MKAFGKAVKEALKTEGTVFNLFKIDNSALDDELIFSVTNNDKDDNGFLENLELMQKEGFMTSLKRDATHFAVIGEQLTGCFVIGLAKRYWFIKIEK